MSNTVGMSFGSNVGLILRIHQFKAKYQCHVHMRDNTLSQENPSNTRAKSVLTTR